MLADAFGCETLSCRQSTATPPAPLAQTATGFLDALFRH